MLEAAESFGRSNKPLYVKLRSRPETFRELLLTCGCGSVLVRFGASVSDFWSNDSSTESDCLVLKPRRQVLSLRQTRLKGRESAIEGALLVALERRELEDSGLSDLCISKASWEVGFPSSP